MAFPSDGEGLQQVFEETRRDYVQSRERLIEDQQLGIVHQCGGDQHALFHPL